MAGASQGMLTRLQINGQAYDFLSASIGVNEQIADTNGMRGSLSHDVGRSRPGNVAVGGQFKFEPNVVEMPLLNTWAMGGAASTLSNTALVYGVIADKIAAINNYASTAVNRATWYGSQGEPLSLMLDVIALDEGTTTWGSPTARNDATGPWMFQELALTIASSTYYTRSFSLTLDNHIDNGRRFNSRTLISLVRTDRTVTLAIDLPDGDSDAVYNSGSAGVSIVGVFTNGANVLRITMPKVVFGRSPITIPGRTELMLPIQGQAMSTGATAELAIVYV